jgi:hypothetical protein
MPTLTSTSTFNVGAAPVAAESVPIFVTLHAGATMGLGRLIHPTLGTLNYTHPPTEWTNIDGDIIAPPVWSSSKTLSGTSNTLWAGNIRDVVCVERWRERGALRMTVGQLRTMLAFYQAPPNPSLSAVTWWPDYTSTLGFRVAMVSLTVGGDGVTLDWVAQQTPLGFVSDRDVELRLRILGRA